MQYKYGVYDVEHAKFVRFEDGDNRILHDAVAPKKHTIVNDGFVRLPADTWKGAGVAIPVFSLRSENSFGVGEFADLKPLADWAKTRRLEADPDFADQRHQRDAHLDGLVSLRGDFGVCAASALFESEPASSPAKTKSLPKTLEPERKRLNALDAVDYEAVMSAKLEFRPENFPEAKRGNFCAARNTRKFFEQNQHWLAPYAAFCVLRDKFGTADFNQWPAHRVYRAKEIAALVESNSAVRTKSS